MNVIKLLTLSLLLSSCFANKKGVKNNIESKYILKISWQDFHGKAKRYWLLEETADTINVYRAIKLNGLNLKVIPLTLPRMSFDYLFCCEKGNMNAVNGKDSQLFIDSLGQNYKTKYEKNYDQEIMEIRLSKNHAFTFTKDTLETNFEFSFLKVKGEFCNCRASFSNPGSSYTDSIVNISKITNYVAFSKGEKNKIIGGLNEFFFNKIIKELLPGKSK